MSMLRRLSHEVRQVVLKSSKQNYKPWTVTYFTRSSLVDQNTYRGNAVNLNLYQDFIKHDFHTSSYNRDVEAGLKCIGAGLAMIGSVGSGIGIGSIFGQVVSGTARNPSVRNQLFGMAILGTVFCETICLFCFVISILLMNA